MKKLLILALIIINILFSKQFILTIDDAPNKYTIPMAEILISNGINALWFITGPNISYHSNTLQYLLSNNFVLGNHTSSHDYDYLKTVGENGVRRDILKINDFLYEQFGYKVEFFRPPYGLYINWMGVVVHELGMVFMPWTIVIKNDVDVKLLKSSCEQTKRNTEILLLHSTKNNLKSLKSLIKEINGLGGFMKVSEYTNRPNFFKF